MNKSLFKIGTWYKWEDFYFCPTNENEKKLQSPLYSLIVYPEHEKITGIETSDYIANNDFEEATEATPDELNKLKKRLKPEYHKYLTSISESYPIFN